MQHRKGFTLIELLVVIAIIAVLAAILFPVFISAKESGRKSKCLGNMKQLAFGLGLYIDVWDDRFAPCNRNGKTYAWARSLLKYTKNTSIFDCPSIPDSLSSPPTAWYTTREKHTDYIYNGYLGMVFLKYADGTSMTGDGDPAKMSAFKISPRYVPALLDGNPKSGLNYGPPCDIDRSNYCLADSGHAWGGDPSTIALYSRNIGTPHQDGTNIVFCDSHVSWTKDAKEIQSYNPYHPVITDGKGG